VSPPPQNGEADPIIGDTMSSVIALSKSRFWLAMSVAALSAFVGLQVGTQRIREIKETEEPDRRMVQLAGETDIGFVAGFSMPRRIYQDDTALFELFLYTFSMSQGDVSHQYASVELSAPDFEFSPSNKLVVPLPPAGQSASRTLLIKSRSPGEKKILVQRSSSLGAENQLISDVMDVRVLPPIKAFGMTADQLDVLKTVATAVGLPSLGALVLGLWQKSADSRPSKRRR